MQLIDEQGKNLGVMDTDKALELARAKGLDLIEIAPKATPPVCRIMEYGKYRYQKSRLERKKKVHQKKVEIKAVRISLRTGAHDLLTKAKQTDKFLNQGHKVRIDMMLRGREKGMDRLAEEKIHRFIESIEAKTKIDQPLKRQPRGFGLVISKDHG